MILTVRSSKDLMWGKGKQTQMSDLVTFNTSLAI